MNLGLGLGLSRRGGPSGPPPLTIDGFSAAFAYSLRRLRTAYTGPLVRVRRSSDNTEQDIGYNISNELDTTALTAFVGANSAFVVTWYDQSGNGRNMTQATQAAQPRLVNAGTLEVRNTKPALFFDGTNDFLWNSAPTLYAANGATFMTVYSPDVAVSGTLRRLYAEASSTNPNPLYIVANQAALPFAGGNIDDLTLSIRNDANEFILNLQTPNEPNLSNAVNPTTSSHIVFLDSGNGIQGYNAGMQGTATPYTRSGTLTLDIAAIGSYFRNGGNSGFLLGRVSEVIGFASDLAPADLQAISDKQGAYYGITISPFLEPPRYGVAGLIEINGTGDGGSSFGVNLGAPDESNDHMFMDFAKSCRGWVYADLNTRLPVENQDAEGAMASLPSGQSTMHFFFSSINDGNGALADPQPNFATRVRLSFTGSATVNFANAGTNVTQINPNTFEFDCDFAGNKWLVFTPTAFPIKVSLIRTSDLAANAGGQFFRQQYLDHLPSGGCARFMIWNNPNFTAATTFAMANPPKTNQRVGGTYDMIDEICTLKSYDPWICIPHAADDAFITAIATYMRDNIPTNRKIRFELANENWNTGTFVATGTHWKGLAESVWGVPDGYVNPGGAWMSYAGKRFAQMMQIINAVFAGQTGRVIGVIGGQAGDTVNSIRHLDAPNWKTFEPGSYVPPYTLAKEISIAPYINFTNSVTQGNALKAQLDISHTAAVNYVLNTMVPAGLAQAKTWIDNHVQIAAGRNLRLTMYEYNQHFDLFGMSGSTLWSGGNPVPGALDVVMEASFRQEMADAQDELRDYFKAQGGSLMCFFQDYQRGSRFGTWGAKTHFAHNSPVWNDLQTWHGANTRWWAQ